MGRTTGKNEIVRAALDSIAFQIYDVITAMERDTGIHLPVLRVDGGPTRNGYLMQFQSDLLNTPVNCPKAEELSAIGAARMAGVSYGLYPDAAHCALQYTTYTPRMRDEERREKLKRWQTAVGRL